MKSEESSFGLSYLHTTATLAIASPSRSTRSPAHAPARPPIAQLSELKARRRQILLAAHKLRDSNLALAATRKTVAPPFSAPKTV